MNLPHVVATAFQFRLPVSAWGAAVSLSLVTAAAVAGPLTVPNASFEAPVTPFVNTRINAWQKTPKPDWYQEVGGYYWDQLAGTFKNTPPGSVDSIDNCHGLQAAWIFAVPEIGFFQDYDSMAWNETVPSRAFDVTYNVGSAYTLTVAVIGGGGGMLPGVTLEMSLYFRDAASNQVTVAAQTITHSQALFSNTTHFVDCELKLPPVSASAPWAGRKLGIKLLSTVTHELEGGYWDVDNVRLVETPAPVLSGATLADGQFQLTLRGEPGLVFELLSAPDPRLPLAAWTCLATLTNVTGTTSFTDAATNLPLRFYRARQVP